MIYSLLFISVMFYRKQKLSKLSTITLLSFICMFTYLKYLKSGIMFYS
jgi:hypothetical protein